MAGFTAKTGAEREGTEYADPTLDQVPRGAFDGLWLVWSEVYSHSNPADWALYAEDSDTAEIVNLYQASPNAGLPPNAVASIPVVQRSIAAWAQITSSGVTKNIANLYTGSRHVLNEGEAGLPVLW
ncbi:MAG: hypothetical protein ACRENX_09590 [Candidatus Dormibacteria bacterium]